MELQLAIEQVVKQYGKDVLLKDYFVNILDDLHAFENSTASKYILKSAVKEGYIKKMVTYSKWNVACSGFIKNIVKKYGYDKKNVDDVLRIVAYSVGILKDPFSKQKQKSSSLSVNFEDIKEVMDKAKNGDVDALKYCAKHHIDPFNCDCDFFTDYSQIKIGDWMYEDGSFSHTKSDLKKNVGVVFSLTTTPSEKQNGWMTGRVVSVSDCDTCVWDDKFDNLPFPHTHYTQEDINNFPNTNSFKDYGTEFFLKDTKISAFKKARAYKVKLPKTKTSGWFLPDINSLLDIWRNLKTQLLNQISLVSVYFYWSASQFDANAALCIVYNFDGTASVSNQYNKMSYCRIRPIFAF